MVETGHGNGAQTRFLYQEPNDRRVVLEGIKRLNPRIIAQ